MDYKRSKLKQYSIVTYLSESQLQEVILRFYKSGVLEHYLYIFHDKDTSVPHYHIFLVFNIGLRQSQVLLSFDGYQDDTGKNINTNIMPVFHPESMFDYFLHNTEDSIKNNKHLYSDNEVFSDNVDYFRNITQIYKQDSASQILNSLMSGFTLIELIEMYGRDFVIYYPKYKELLNDLGFVYNSNLKKFVERSVENEDRYCTNS